jgi:hypothetical protein
MNNLEDITLNSMFRDSQSFNQNIGSFDVSRCVDFTNMFQQAIKFNNGGSPDINNWTLRTTGIVNMTGMFSTSSFVATIFNQPLNNWNTIAVTNMNNMFGGFPTSPANVTFNQDIGLWNVSNVTNFSNFMHGKNPSTFSTANLDAIYNGWSSRTVKTPITITFGSTKRTSASNAGKSILTASPNNWVITDGGI